MKKINLCFQLHQPYRLRRYRFFDIGNAHHYNDDYLNEDIFRRIASSCYMPANRLMLELLEEYPDFRVSYVMSGLVIEQMEYYSPEVIQSFKALVGTGRVELLGEPYAHSISSLYDPEEFQAQVKMHRAKLKELFGYTPKVFCNTELIYDDDIAKQLKSLGYEATITEGAKHILGWKSPNFIYQAINARGLKLLLRNAALSEMISKDFSRYNAPDYPVTVDKLLDKIASLPEGEDFVNLYMNYEVLGIMNHSATGIFDFFRALPRLCRERNIGFATPRELIDSHRAIGDLSVLYPISGSSEEKGVNEWSGNILQQGVIKKLTEWGHRIRTIGDRAILQDWLYLQASDHLYYMNTVNNGGHPYSPYTSPYDAFNNYMNVLSDLLLRAENICPSSIDTEELNAYQTTIQNQDKRIAELEAELKVLQKGSLGNRK